MLHQSALDADGQRLFVTVAPTDSTSAIGVVDLAHPDKPMKVIGEGVTPDLHDTLVCMHWDSRSAKLVGVLGLKSLELHQLDPTSQQWDPARTLKNVPRMWDVLGGNAATVSAFDVDARAIFLLAGAADPVTGALKLDLATVNVEQASVTAHPPLASIGMPGCDSCVLAMSL